MIGSSPLGSYPLSDFEGESLFLSLSSSGGAIGGGTSTVVRDKGYDGVAGAIGGGAVSYTFGLSGEGYPIYGDVMYGDMPYLERQSAGVGGAVGGGRSEYIRQLSYEFQGGALAGGEFPYVRIKLEDMTGGALAGGYGDEDGDFSKVISVTFQLKWPEVLFVPPSERWDIPRLLKELE